MKKILPTLVLLSVLTVLAAPLAVSAVEGPVECCALRRAIEIDDVTFERNAVVGPRAMTLPECPSGTVSGLNITPNWGVVCLINTVNSVVDWVFLILISVAVIMALIGAITFITASGSPEKAMAGRNYLIFALVGLIVALLARAAPNIIRAVAGF